MLNQIAIEGYVKGDPIIRKTQAGVLMALFQIEQQQDGTNKMETFQCVAYDKAAENLHNVCEGNAVSVAGRLREGYWTDDDGNTHRQTQIRAARVYMIGGPLE